MHQLIVEIDGSLDPTPILDKIKATHPDVLAWALKCHKWIPMVDHPVGWRQFTLIPTAYRKGKGPMFEGETKVKVQPKPREGFSQEQLDWIAGPKKKHVPIDLKTVYGVPEWLRNSYLISEFAHLLPEGPTYDVNDARAHWVDSQGKGQWRN